MKKKKRGLSAQITILIILGVLLVGVITYFSQYYVSIKNVKTDITQQAEQAILETISAVREYPAYEWLLSYWYKNADHLDVEYDAGFKGGTATTQKLKQFQERHPELQIRYMTSEVADALSDEDQKLYAEIVYSWILDRVDESKKNLGCDFLSLLVTDTEDAEHPYGKQCFLMSGADKDAERGTQYGQVYTLGVTTSVDRNDTAADSMKRAVEAKLADWPDPDSGKAVGEDPSSAGSYLDYYQCAALIGKQAYLVSASYNIEKMTSLIRVKTLKSTLLAALYQFLLLELVMVHLIRYVIQPLKKIIKNIRVYSETRDSAAVQANMTEILSGKRGRAVRENEIGQLAEDFSSLTEDIDDYVEQIKTVTSQKEKYETELSIAAQIQEQVLPDELPQNPGRDKYELCATMAPAREVGGDFYDYFFIDEDHIALVIGDVSDKGVPAALFMMIAKTLIENHAKMGESPAEVISHVNDQLSENNKAGYFVTVWFAVIDLTTGRGVGINAGHEHPAVCQAGGKYELIRYKHSRMIGVMPGMNCIEHEFRMNPGEKLFVYTDGVPEAVNKDNEQFGTDRMLDVLNRNIDAKPEELLARMKAEIDAFAGEVPQFDDTTMLYFHYKGEKQV